MNKQRALTLGVISAIAIIGGIILAVLLQQLMITVIDGHVNINATSNMNEAVWTISGGTWLFGMVYIIPGILGVIAALVQNKCMYVTTCVFSMISLFIMSLVFLIAGLTLLVFILSMGSNSDQCRDEGVCQCKRAGSFMYEDTQFRTCALFTKFVALFMSVFLFIVLSWIAVLVEFIASCYFSCRSTSSTTGVVLVSSQQPMLPPGEEVGPGGYGTGYPLPSKV